MFSFYDLPLVPVIYVVRCLIWLPLVFLMGSLMQLVSESVKTKQAQSFLLSEKQALAKQLHLVNASVESLKMRIFHCEEQVIVST